MTWGRVYVTGRDDIDAVTCSHCNEVRVAVIVPGGTDETICEDCLKGLLAKLRDATPVCDHNIQVLLSAECVKCGYEVDG